MSAARLCMRALGAGLAAALLASCAAPAGPWKLVWADEFEGNAVDTARWTFETGGHGWGNKELEHYTPGANARVENGMLVIEARKEEAGGRHYTSTRMNTHGKASWTYGRVEARIKMPRGKGMWPAFWMLGDNIGEVGWPRCGEIDIVEMVGGPSPEGAKDQDAIASGAVHRANLDPSTKSEVKSNSTRYPNPGGAKLGDDFHVYAVEWSPAAIVHSMDGKVFQTVDISSRADGYDAFHRPFFVLLNLAVGGDWPGAPDETTAWPQRMLVDWVRVYQHQP